MSLNGRRIRNATAVALLVTAASCSLTPLSELQSGDDDPCETCSDAGADIADLDVALDSGDASADVMDTGTSFCGTQPSSVDFCKDFDDGKPVGFGFTSLDELTPGLVSLDLLEAKSVPGSMQARVLAGTADDDSYAYVGRTFDGTFQSVVLRVQILIDPGAIATSLDVVGISINPDTNSHRINLELTPSGARIEQAFPLGDGGTGYQDDGLAAFPLADTWSAVELKLTLGTSPTLSVTIDGRPAGDIALVTGFTPGSVRILIGPTFAPSLTQDLSVHLDDIALDLE